jgi:hypothetical protein
VQVFVTALDKVGSLFRGSQTGQYVHRHANSIIGGFGGKGSQPQWAAVVPTRSRLSILDARLGEGPEPDGGSLELHGVSDV